MVTIKWEEGASSPEGLREGHNVGTLLNMKHLNFGWYDKWITDFSFLLYFFNYKVELCLWANCLSVSANCLLMLYPHSGSTINHFLLIC